MASIVGLPGSLRRGSFNAALLRAATQLVPDGSRIDVHSLHGVPLYDADVETAEGIPPAVAVLKDAVAAADGLLMVTPEYNNSLPGVFKNAIDWMTRPAADIARVFGGKPVAVIGASPGGFGTQLGQNRSEEHTSELQSLMRISHAGFCLKKKKHYKTTNY